MATVAVTCIKNGRTDSFGRPLIAGTYYQAVEINTANALWNAGYVSVADASVFDQDPLAGTSPLDDFNVARSIAISRQPIETAANLSAELNAIEIVGLDIIEDGVEMTQIFSDVTNVAQVAALPTTPQKLSLYYAALDGDAGTIKVVVDAYGAAQAETRFARSDGYTPINPGETVELIFDPRTRPSSIYVKATSALTGGKHNQLQVRERGTMMLPAIASSLSSKLRAWWPCDQASPDVVLTDRSGNSKNVTFPAALTAANAWASAGGLTVPYYPSTDTTLQYPRLSAAAFNEMFTFSRGDAILIHMDTDIVLPAANSYLFGSGNAPSATDRGFSLRVSPTGGLIGCFFPEGASSIYSTIIGTPPSAVGRHSVAMHVDATLKYMSIYLDGVAIRTGFDLSAVASSIATTTGFGIGGAPTYAGGRDQGISQKIYDFQVYSWKASEGTLPTASEVAAIAARLHSVRGALLSQELV